LKLAFETFEKRKMLNYLSNLDFKDRDTQIYAGAAIGAVTAGFLVRRSIRKHRENAPIPAGAFPVSDLPKDCYDAIIVGAGMLTPPAMCGSFS
jgi:hypothetical protein